MDTHTLELLEFDKIRALVAARAACSLGKESARRMEPSGEPGEIRSRQALTTEMTEALNAGLSPPFGGLHDIRPQVRRAQIGAMLDAEELARVAGQLLQGPRGVIGAPVPQEAGDQRDLGAAAGRAAVGRRPQPGDEVRMGEVTLRIEAVDGNRITRLQVALPESADA